MIPGTLLLVIMIVESPPVKVELSVNCAGLSRQQKSMEGWPGKWPVPCTASEGRGTAKIQHVLRYLDCVGTSFVKALAKF